MQTYIEFVEEQIAKYKDLVTIGDGVSIEPWEIQNFLSSYGRVLFGLIAEHERAINNLKRKEKVYTLWWDKIFLEARKTLNPIDLSAQKWASKSELESYARVTNEEEYLQRSSELEEEESKERFLSRLIDTWAGIGKKMEALNSNTQRELYSLNIVDRAQRTVRKDSRLG